jgi:hypothetical protein
LFYLCESFRCGSRGAVKQNQNSKKTFTGALPELVGQLLLSAQAPPDQLPQGAFLFNHFGDVT